MSSTSAATSAGRCRSLPIDGLARPELALERDRPVDHRLDRRAVVGLGAKRGHSHRHAERGGTAALEQEAKGQEVVVERLQGDRPLQPRLEAGDRAGQDRGKSALALGHAVEGRRGVREPA